MGVEIERKFLLKDDSWRRDIDETHIIRQGYLTNDPKLVTRVRMTNADNRTKSHVTIKGETVGITRAEFEYSIPYADAVEMMKLCKDHLVEKHRHIVFLDDLKIEIDEFINDNHGLAYAEIELPTADLNILTSYDMPEWLGNEIVDKKYFNSELSKNPFKNWK